MLFLEFISTSIALSTTFLTIRQKSIRWPIDILIITINLLIHHKLKLYDRWIFSFVNILIDIYGWYKWRGGVKKKRITKIKKASFISFFKFFGFGILLTYLLYQILIKLNSDYAYLSAFRTIFCWFALWLASQKKQEHWFIWIFLNFIAIYIYIQKGLVFFPIKYYVYILLNVYGYYKWENIRD